MPQAESSSASEKFHLYVEFAKNGVRQRWSLRDAHNPAAVLLQMRKDGAADVVCVKTNDTLPEGPL